MAPIRQSENLVKFCVRAVYIPLPDGTRKLARVQKFSFPVFLLDGWELDCEPKRKKEKEENKEPTPENIERAVRRAKNEAFDFILCNADLDTFCTFTYAPDAVADKASYDECYEVLRVWLSNRVQRRGLKYVLVPERHKSGAVHFHMLCNSDALKLVRAVSARTGRPLSHDGRAVYNVTDWTAGFSTAELIDRGASDREAVAKYIFKYMGKQAGAKIGGRHFLHGGDLKMPEYELDNDERVFLPADIAPAFVRSAHPAEGVVFREWSFI